MEILTESISYSRIYFGIDQFNGYWNALSHDGLNGKYYGFFEK